MVRSTKIGFAAILSLVSTIGCGEHNSNVQLAENKVDSEKLLGNDELLGLTQSQCTTEALAKVTASPRAQLYINAPEVLSDARARNSVNNSGPGGAWSFAFAMREILELPADPGVVPANLLAEERAVDSFIEMFSAQTVNGISAPARSQTRELLTKSWVKRKDSAGIQRRWLGGAPFKLLAIVNRMDIVKRTSTGALDPTTTGEGRLVFGFTGTGSMSVIFEYNLPVGSLNPTTGTTQASWTALWRDLKNHLQDTDSKRTGVQPDQSLANQPSLSDKARYLTALEAVTNRFVRRTSQKRSPTASPTQAAISQIRTNEFIEDPWQLREIVRGRSSAGTAVLRAATTKNALVPTQAVEAGKRPVTIRDDRDLGDWVDRNVSCSNATNLSSCRFTPADFQLPQSIAIKGKTFRSGSISNADFGRWFDADQGNLKRRFFALQSCDGCHQSETGVFFTHTDVGDGSPSSFLTGAFTVGSFEVEADLSRRLRNFKNLVCLAAPTATALNLNASRPLNEPLEKRVGVSESVH